MIGSNHRRAARIVLAALVVCCVPLVTQAGTINIILSAMDVSYTGNTDGGVLYDSMGGTGGGGMNPALADEITTAVFQLDGNVVSTLMMPPTDIRGDFRLINVGPTITKGILNSGLGANGGGFGFDFFTDSGFQLRLGMTSVDLLITDGVFFFTGEATVLPGQNLPAGLKFNESLPVQISYTATLPAVQAGATTNMAMASGAWTISGIEVPEPTTNLLLCTALGLVSFQVLRRKRAMALVPVRN